MKRTVFQAIIIGFCLWHMFAVAIFAIPREASDSFSVLTRTALLPVVTPYLDVFSQWQLWNLFAPDPLRVISLYRIETEEADGQWKEALTIKPGTYPVWEHSVMWKYLGNVMGVNGDAMDAMKRQFLHTLCEEKQWPAGTHVRMAIYSTSLPIPTLPTWPSFWNTWTPDWTRTDGVDTTCTAS